MTSRPIVARSRAATYLHRGQHHVRRHPHTLQLRHQWRTPGRFVDAASSIYGVHFALWMVLLAVFVLGLALDAATAGGLAAGTGFFSGIFRRPADADADQELDQAAAETWATVGEDPLAEPDEVARAIERTDVIAAVEVDEVDAHAAEAMAILQAANNELQQEAARYRRQAGQERRNAERASRAATDAVRFFKDDRDKAVREAQELRRARDERWPVPDDEVLGEHLIRVAHEPLDPRLPTSQQLKVRRRTVGQAAKQAVCRRWEIADWPITPAAELTDAEAEQVKTAFRAAIKQSRPADARWLTPQEVAELDAEADRRLAAREELARVLHDWDRQLPGAMHSPWESLTEFAREYYLGAAAHVQARYRRGPKTSPGGGADARADSPRVPAPGDPADSSWPYLTSPGGGEVSA